MTLYKTNQELMQAVLPGDGFLWSCDWRAYYGIWCNFSIRPAALDNRASTIQHLEDVRLWLNGAHMRSLQHSNFAMLGSDPWSRVMMDPVLRVAARRLISLDAGKIRTVRMIRFYTGWNLVDALYVYNKFTE